MPIYEHACTRCRRQFEQLFLPSVPNAPACPACGSQDLEKLLSAFALSTPELTKARVNAARKQMSESRDHKDKQVAEAEYVSDHLREHH